MVEHTLMVIGRWCRAVGNTRRFQNHELQFLRTTMKTANRAAVHGVKPPIPKTIEEEEVEKEIKKAVEEKEKKTKEVEKAVNTQTNSSSSPRDS